MAASAFKHMDSYRTGKPMTYFLYSSLTKERLVAFLERSGASQACIDAAISNLADMYVQLLQAQEKQILSPTERAKRGFPRRNDVTPVPFSQEEKRENGDADVNREKTANGDMKEATMTNGSPLDLHTAPHDGSQTEKGSVGETVSGTCV